MEVSLKTGPVRMSGYALKLRRATNAALRKLYQEKKIEPKIANQMLTDLNKSLYEILINKYNIPKDAVINIELVLDISDSNLNLKDINISIYNKDDILSGNVTKELKQLLKL
ncbi:DUF2258 domain-containing protein [Fervidicoccus fontis]|uniref:DUF2258 domain-containing protein n=1 Tax=Fervidicoccus fontis TaxID=683846 RepID=A0A2J6N3Y8_9CREN|nr:DUF2258 domain-containing protein [Fervidicoccus fontis]MBE9390950.1 DUF2258 domain-containing protein [Fervidicoccus fontis]PMB76025.1 MAG: DUF2258 domain-containing protein [Fervidicoccus fontis]HEW64303.1 DUF2258 domain-containing protein [Fervidicoccus fontis]